MAYWKQSKQSSSSTTPQGWHQKITYEKKKVNTYPKAYQTQSLGRGRPCHSN